MFYPTTGNKYSAVFDKYNVLFLAKVFSLFMFILLIGRKKHTFISTNVVSPSDIEFSVSHQ